MSKEDELAEIESQIQSLVTEVNTDSLHREEIRNQIEEIQAQVRKQIEALNDEAQRLAERNFHKRRHIRELNARREFLARQAEEEKKNQDLLQKYDEIRQQLEDIRTKFSWSQAIKKHQIEGAEFITLHKRLILADVMGLGKTLTAISAIDMIREVTKDLSSDNIFVNGPSDRFPVGKPAGKRVLYLSSAELSYGVVNEFRKWSPHLNVVPLTGQSKATRRVVIDTLKNMMDEFVVIINYEAWRKDLNLLVYLGELKFDTVIFDESHKLKEGERNIGYRGVSSILSQTEAPYRIAITGTPVLNKPQELFPQLALLDPYLFYSEKQFLNEYCIQIKDKNDKMRWTFAPGGIDLLYRKIGPIILRRTKKDAGIELPDKTVIEHELEIDEELYPHQARARREMRIWGSIQLDPANTEKGYISAAAQIAVLTRLRQIEVWPAGITLRDPLDKDVIRVELDVQESQKLDYIINPTFDMGLAVDALAGNERVVIFSQFVEPLRELHKRFTAQGYRPALFVGDASREHKEEVKKDFDAYYTKDEDAKYDVVLANYKIGGEGVNFTGASQMIILDEEWNPGKRDQAYDRIHRMGQQKPVTVHVIRVKNTVDDWLRDLIQFKEGMVGEFQDVFAENEAFNALKEGKI